MKNAGRMYIYAFSHLAVMFAAYFTMAAAAVDSRESGLILLLFAVLSFGQRMAFGTLADRVNDLRPLLLAGMFLAAWGALFFGAPVVGAVLAGTGSALFAPSAVAGAMRSRPGDAGRMGVFSFMGLLGAGSGAAVGLSLERISPPLVTLLLLVCMIAVWITGSGEAVGAKVQVQKGEPRRTGIWTAILSFLSIAAVAYMIMTQVFTPLSELSHLNLMGKAVPLAAGALFGGLLAQRLGYNVVCPVFIAAGGLLLGFAQGAFTFWLGLFALSAALPSILCAGMRAIPGCAGLGYGFMIFGAAAGMAVAVITDMGLLYAPHTAAVALLPALITLLAYPASKASRTSDTMMEEQGSATATQGMDAAETAGRAAGQEEVIVLCAGAGLDDADENRRDAEHDGGVQASRTQGANQQADGMSNGAGGQEV